MIQNIFLLLALTVHAEDFQPAAALPQKIQCSVNKQSVKFADLKESYILYEKNLSAPKILSCDRLELNGLHFYTVLFSSEVHEGPHVKKILTFEVALKNKTTNKFHTVRSEIVDQVELWGDLTTTEFDSTLRALWGYSKKDGRILLNFEINTKNEKPFSYLLKLNAKNSWFENVFNVTSEKSKLKKTK